MTTRIGRHINISHGFLTATDYAERIGCNIFQIFLGPPAKIKNKPRDNEELVQLGKDLIEKDIKMVIHGSYIINLSNPIGSKKSDDSIGSLVQDLNASKLIGKNCIGVIIHMGKNIKENNIDNETALDNYAKGLVIALEKTSNKTTIILETGASQGTEVGSTLEFLGYIYWNVPSKYRYRIKFCIDTCHIWATGYDISNKKGVDAFFKLFDCEIGLENIVCIHFNDSKTGLASFVDRHADLGYGHIKDIGLSAIANFANEHQIPIIMETPLSAVNPKTNQDVTIKEELMKVKSWLSKKK